MFDFCRLTLSFPFQMFCQIDLRAVFLVVGH